MTRQDLIRNSAYTTALLVFLGICVAAIFAIEADNKKRDAKRFEIGAEVIGQRNRCFKKGGVEFRNVSNRTYESTCIWRK